MGIRERPEGELMLVSDKPMIPQGVKTSKSDEGVTVNYVSDHLEIGIKSLQEIKNNGRSVRHLRFK